MAEAAPKFTCTGCQRSYAWKPELAGKRAACKCGQRISVEAAPPPPPPPQDDIYDIAETADASPARPPRVAPQALAVAAVAPAGPSGTAVLPLSYARGPTPRDLER